MEAKGTKRQIASNTLTGWAGMAIRMAIALVMVPFLLRNLGKEGYGLIGLIGSIVALSAMADLGLRQALGRELSEKVARKDVKGFRVLSSTALALYLGIATILITVGWVFAPWLVSVFKVGEPLRKDAVWLLRFYGCSSILFSFITPVFTAGLQSLLRFDALNLVQTACGILQNLFLFLCISFLKMEPLVVWATVMVIMASISLFILWLLYRKWCFCGRLGLQYLEWKELTPLFQLGGYMFVLQMANTLLEGANPLIISFFLGTGGVAVYQMGQKLSDSLRPVILTLSTQVHPLTTRYHVLNQQDNQRKMLVFGTRYTMLLGVIFSAGIILFAEPFCRLWLISSPGSDCEIVAKVMRLCALVDIFVYSGAMHWPALLGMKKMNFALAVQIPSGLIYIMVAVYLVGFTDWGILGVLLATLLMELVRRPVVTWYVLKMTGLSMKEYVHKAYATPLVIFVLLLFFYGVLKVLPAQNWITLILLAGVYSVCASLMIMAVERRVMLDLLRQWRQK